MTISIAAKINGVTPIKDHVLVRDMNFGNRQLASGIVLPGDDAKTAGIRPRWAQVYAVGPLQTDVSVGEWVLVAHGRWTRGSKVEICDETMTIRRIDTDDILLVSDEEPTSDENISTAVQAHAKTRG